AGRLFYFNDTIGLIEFTLIYVEERKRMEKIIFKMNDASVKRVCEQDPDMKKLITIIGDIDVVLRSDYFASLVRSIIGQQISVSAASAIYGRLQQLVNGHITAEGLLEQSTEHLRSVGVPRQTR